MSGWGLSLSTVFTHRRQEDADCMGMYPGTTYHRKCDHMQSQECHLLVWNDRQGTDSNTAAYGLFFWPNLSGQHLAPQLKSWPQCVVGSRERVHGCAPYPRDHGTGNTAQLSCSSEWHWRTLQMTHRHCTDEGRLRAEAELQKNFCRVCPLRCEPLELHRMLFPLLQVMPEIWPHKCACFY